MLDGHVTSPWAGARSDVGVHLVHCDSGMVCSSHQPGRLEGGDRFGLQRVHAPDGVLAAPVLGGAGLHAPGACGGRRADVFLRRRSQSLWGVGTRQCTSTHQRDQKKTHDIPPRAHARVRKSPFEISSPEEPLASWDVENVVACAVDERLGDRREGHQREARQEHRRQRGYTHDGRRRHATAAGAAFDRAGAVALVVRLRLIRRPVIGQQGSRRLDLLVFRGSRKEPRSRDTRSHRASTTTSHPRVMSGGAPAARGKARTAANQRRLTSALPRRRSASAQQTPRANSCTPIVPWHPDTVSDDIHRIPAREEAPRRKRRSAPSRASCGNSGKAETASGDLAAPPRKDSASRRALAVGLALGGGGGTSRQQI